MSMSWAGKIRNAIEGAVDGTDVLGRLASTAQLESFRRQLADLRLEAEIANTSEPWRVPFVLAAIGAPLWLAESLVTLAQSFAEAEAAAHPDRLQVMAVPTHGQLQLLLGPVETLQSELSGMLADPHRRSALALPLLARPYAQGGVGLASERVAMPYVRGLLAGAMRIAGSIQVLIADYGSFYQHATAPSWLVSALATMKGDLAATQSRLDAAESRSVALFRSQAPDEAALRDLASDLWEIANAMLKCGQLIAAPALLPSASRLPPAGSALQSNRVPSDSAPPARAAGSPDRASAEHAPVSEPGAAEPAPFLIEIGSYSDSAAPPTGMLHVIPAQDIPRAMPRIGGASGPPPPSTRTAQPASRVVETHPAALPMDSIRAMPSIGDPIRSPVPAQKSPNTTGTKPPDASAKHAEEPRALPRIGGPDRRAASPTVAAHLDPREAVGGAHEVRQAAEASTQHVDSKDRWMLSGSGTRHRLRAAGQEDQAEQDLAAFWSAKGWSLTALEARYLGAVASLVAEGAVSPEGRSLKDCPYAQIFRVTTNSIQVLGRTLNRGTYFSYEYQTGGRGLVTDLTPRAGTPDNPGDA